jgi:ATP-dependent Zn protease
MSFLGRMRLGSGGLKIGIRPQEVLYSEFLTLVESDNVKDVRFEEGTGRILFDLTPHSSVVVMTHSDDKVHVRSQTKDSSDTARVSLRGRSSILKQFYTRHLPDQQLISLLRTHGVEFGTIRASVTSSIVRVVATALALWIPLIPMFIIMRRFLEGRSGNGGRRKNSNSKSNVPTTRFRDVAGIGAAKRELMEVVDCLQDGSTYSKLGAKLPSGVLLSGPPGTGKTLLARAVAGEAGVPFISVSASEFVEMFVGRGAARVRELFSEARRLAPCVIFIDELDAVGSRRGMGMNEERDQTLNQLLTELDGFEGRPGVVLLAATNRPDVLDPALLRPGRLSRRIVVSLPDEQGRAEIASVHLRGVPLEGNGNSQDPVEPSVLLNRASNVIAKLSFGFSGAEIANVVNEAAFLAARRKSETVSLADLVDAVSRTRFGVGGGAESANWAAPLRRWVFEQLQPNDQSTRAIPMQ